MNNDDLDWNLVRIFLTVAEQKTLSAAAAVLGMSQPTVGRQVARFETSLNLQLFHRRQTGYELTEEGRRLVRVAVTMGQSASEVLRAAELENPGRRITTVRLAVGQWGLSFLSNHLSEFAGADPELKVQLFADDDYWDLSRNTADFALRNRPPNHPHLIAQKLGDVEVHAYAAPAFRDRYPEARDSEKWQSLPWAGYCGRDRISSSIGLAEILNGNAPQYAVNGSMALLSVLKSGCAIGLLPAWIGEFEGLVRLSVKPISQRESWLSFHEQIRFHSKLKGVKDAVCDLYQRRFQETKRRLTASSSLIISK